MSATGQFVFFLVALILFGLAAIIRFARTPPALDAALVAAGLAAWVFVSVYNAAKAM